jgi:flagellar biogenesis protein FliO
MDAPSPTARVVAPASSPAAAGTTGPASQAAAVELPAASSAIPFKPAGTLEAQGVGLPAALLVCLLLLAAAVVLLRRGVIPPLAAGRPARALQVVESRLLGDGVRVSVLRYRGRELLVAHSEHVVSVLADGPADATQGPQP